MSEPNCTLGVEMYPTLKLYLICSTLYGLISTKFGLLPKNVVVMQILFNLNVCHGTLASEAQDLCIDVGH